MERSLMPHQGLLGWRIPITLRLSSVNDPPHFLLFLLRQLHIPRRPVLFKTSSLGSSWDGNKTLGSNPGQRDLSDRAALTDREFLDLVHNGAILVEIFSLEFGDWVLLVGLMYFEQMLRLTSPTEIIRCEVVRGLELEVIDQPAMA